MDYTTLEPGDVIRVVYYPTNGDRTSRKELVSKVESVQVDIIEGIQFAEVYLAFHRDAQDSIPRRRITTQGKDSPTLESRRTTVHGARWQRINQIAKCEVELSRTADESA